MIATKLLFIPIMRAQRHHGDIYFEVMDFVNHTIVLIDAAAPRLFIHKMLQVLHLSRACARMFLKFKKHVRNFLDGSLVTTLLDGSKLYLRLLGKQNNVCHTLQGVYQRNNILLALQTRERGLGSVRLADVLLNGLQIAAVGKERVTRWADLIRVDLIIRFQQFAGQPTAVALRERKALDICPKLIRCYCCHRDK